MKRVPHVKIAKKFRAQKRAEYKRLMKAADHFQVGCAFIPRKAREDFTDVWRRLVAIGHVCRPWWKNA